MSEVLPQSEQPSPVTSTPEQPGTHLLVEEVAVDEFIEGGRAVGNDPNSTEQAGDNDLRVPTGVRIDRSNPTAALLEEMISQSEERRVSHSDLMRVSLFGPYGYYSKGRAEIGTGEGVDFPTSPEKTPLFAQTLVKSAKKVWEAMGRPERFDVVEMGAGMGTLADTFIDYVEEDAVFYEALNYIIVEYGDLIAKQRGKIRNQEKVRWVQGSASELPLQDESITGIFLSNELPDTFPVEKVKKVGGAVKQKYITLENDEWVEIWDEPSKEVKTYIADYGLTILEAVEEPINLNAPKWQKGVDRALKRGAIITIDYGANGLVGKKNVRATREYMRGAPGSELPLEVAYASLGAYDITANVNFDILGQTARHDGLTVAFSGLQREFLINNGIYDFMAPLYERIRQTKSWSEIIALGKDIYDYQEFQNGVYGKFYCQVLTKGVAVDFQPQRAATPRQLSGTGVRLSLGTPNTPIKRFKLPSEAGPSEVFTDDAGFISLDALSRWPHYLARTILQAPDNRIILNGWDSEVLRTVLVNSGYDYDLAAA